MIGEIKDRGLILNVFSAFFAGNLSVSNFYIQSGGVYMLPEPVPHDGRVLHVRAYGYFSGENLLRVLGPDPESAAPSLLVLVFRLDEESKSYQILYNHLLTHGEFPGEVNLDWQVQRGDRIGAFIPYSCNSKNITGDTILLCPSQINIRVERSSCLSALYHPADLNALNYNDSIPADQFQEVQVQLNIEALISPTSM